MTSQPIPSGLRRRVERLRELFPGREGVFAVQQRNGSYLPERRPLADADLADHLGGAKTVGVYLLRSDNAVKFAAVDIDVNEQHRADAVAAAAVDLGLDETQVQVEFSGRKGFHVLFCFEEWVAARLARDFVTVISSAAGAVVGRPELFPKQGALPVTGNSPIPYTETEIPITPGVNPGVMGDGSGNIPITGAALGSLLKLPLGVHQVSRQRSRFLRQHIMQTIETETVEAVVERNRELLRPYTAPAVISAVREPLPCFAPMLGAHLKEGDGRDQIAFTLAIHMQRQGLADDVARAVLTSWNSWHSPPLADSVVERKLQQGYKATYGLGCDNPMVARFCAGEQCPIFRARSRKAG